MIHAQNGLRAPVKQQPGKRIPAGVGGYFRDLFQSTLLTREQERQLFEELDRLRQQAQQLEQRLAASGDQSLHPPLARARKALIDARNHIAKCNLRLVVSVAQALRQWPTTPAARTHQRRQ